jgi:hypothetical protein
MVTNGIYDFGGHSVEGGTTNRVAVTNAVTIQSVNGPSVTYIVGYQIPVVTNGDAAVRCAYLADGALLSGFTLTNGATQDYITGSDFNGGGVWCENRNARLTNCVITGNVAYLGGGGAESGSLDHCWITGNRTYRGPGGGAEAAALNSCIISSNSAAAGGGASGCTLTNCAVVGNFAFVRGSGSGVGGGITGGQAYNTIIYYNDCVSGLGPDIFFDGQYWFCCSSPDTAVLVTNEPGFIDLAGGNFRLQTNSPCINSGANSYTAPGPDLDGSPRITGGKADIGPYEFQNPSSVISYAWLQANGFPTDGTADFADPDGDHMDNWHEWIAGTDPNDASSLLTMYPLAPGNDGGILLSWQSSSQPRTYFLERSTDGPQGPWTLFASGLTSFPPTNQYLDFPPAAANAVFYRVWTDPEQFNLP